MHTLYYPSSEEEGMEIVVRKTRYGIKWQTKWLSLIVRFLGTGWYTFGIILWCPENCNVWQLAMEVLNITSVTVYGKCSYVVMSSEFYCILVLVNIVQIINPSKDWQVQFSLSFKTCHTHSSRWLCLIFKHQDQFHCLLSNFESVAIVVV